MKHISSGMSSSFESEKIPNILSKKKANQHAAKAKSKILTAFVAEILLFYDLYWQEISEAFGIAFVVIWWAECLLVTVLTLYIIRELYGFFMVLVFPTIVDVTETEATLLGINDNEPGFRKTPKKPASNLEQSTIKFSPTLCQSNSHSFTPLYNSPNTPSTTMQSSPNATMEDSFHSFAASPPAYHSKSWNDSVGALPTSPFDRGSQVRKRISPTNHQTAAMRELISNSTIKDIDTFLLEEANKRQQIRFGFRTRVEKVSIPVAPRSSQTSNSSTSSDDHPSKYSADEVWTRAGYSQNVVNVWIENIRYWLGQTIVQTLAQEIIKVNKELKSVGSEDVAIGEVGVSTLKNLAFVKSSSLPTLNNIIPYLEISSNQEYLVHRIKTLGKDGCIAEFNWDGGSEFNGQKWEDYLPTDAAIVMHLFCTYLDARLPSNPKYPDGKAFSSQHLMKAPEKPNFINKKDYLCLYQTRVNPPHFKLIVGNEIQDLPKGRNNMFQAILLLLLHIRDKNNGMLGHVSFGPSGVNMLWVLSEKYR